MAGIDGVATDESNSPTFEKQVTYSDLWFYHEYDRSKLYWSGVIGNLFFGAVDGAVSAHGEQAILPFGGLALPGMVAAGACGFDLERKTNGPHYHGQTASARYVMRNRPLKSLDSVVWPMILPAATYWVSRGVSYSLVKLTT